MLRVIVLSMFSLFAVITSAAQDIDQEALEQLVNSAAKAHSDALVIYKDGKLIGEWYFGSEPRKIDIKSVTKSIVNLGIGILETEGKLELDQPVADFYPEWNQENKREITIRHLLTHTTGMLNSEFELIESSPDIVRFALASDLTHPPGKHYLYNNKAVNLLAGIVEKADGRKLDVVIRDELFEPLEITDIFWPRDQAGNPYVMAFLEMKPQDLAKIGLFVLNKGSWKGDQIIGEHWFDISLSQGADFLPEYGLLWELIRKDFRIIVDESQIESIKNSGVDPRLVKKAEQMRGTYNGYSDYYGKITDVFGNGWMEWFRKELAPYGLQIGRKEAGEQMGIMGMGYLGQYLVIYPQHNLVAVRLIKQFEGYNWDTDEFTHFPQGVQDLIK